LKIYQSTSFILCLIQIAAKLEKKNLFPLKLLIILGMERVAQELMGGRKWRKLMTPFNSLEQREPQDWSQSETCYFCNTKTQSPYVSQYF
jgi:hypothetical protein